MFGSAPVNPVRVGFGNIGLPVWFNFAIRATISRLWGRSPAGASSGGTEPPQLSCIKSWDRRGDSVRRVGGGSSGTWSQANVGCEDQGL